MAEAVKKTQDVLGRIISKPPLTEKLLSRPPFRYLHDLFSEIISATGFGNGLYDEYESNSENVKEKEAKVAYLTKMIDCLGLATGVEVSANPLKIVAGLEPEATNEFLQLIGMAVLNQVDTTEAVQRVLAGEHHQGQGRGNSAGNVRAASSDSLAKTSKSSKSEKQRSHPKLDSQGSQNSLADREAERERKEREAELREKERLREREKEREKEREREREREREIERERERERQKEREQENKENDAEQKNEDAATSSDSLNRDTMMPRQRLMRPTTARPAPPRQRAPQVAIEELTRAASPAIITESTKDADDDEFTVQLHDTTTTKPVELSNSTSSGNNLDKEPHGGLVRKLLETKREMEGRDPSKPETPTMSNKEKIAAKKEIEVLRESIQTLCQSTNPLGRTLDYMQEDIDAMSKELEVWKKESTKWKGKLQEELRVTQESLIPLEAKLKEVESAIEEQLEKISISKAAIVQNDQTIASLLKNITQPMR